MKSNSLEALSVCCITFNLHAEAPTQETMDQLLKEHKAKNYDLYIIGTEECLRSILVSLVYWNKSVWENQIHEYLGKDRYMIIGSQSLSAIHIIGFIRGSLYSKLSNIGTNYIKTGGLGNTLGNKGAVYLFFKYCNLTFMFINSHLAAFKHNKEKRNESFEYILKNISVNNNDTLVGLFPGQNNLPFYKGIDVLNKFDFAIFMGDLNSRTDCTLEFVDECIKEKNIDKLLKVDQLINSIRSEEVDIDGFQESPIKFMPTFKFVPGTNDYAETEENCPSFTDRILYRSNNDELKTIEVVEYNANFDLTISDHKPVNLIFNVYY